MEFRDSTGQLIRTRSTPLFTTPQVEGAAMQRVKVFTPKAINECPDCQFTTASYDDFLEHRVRCLRERRIKQEFQAALATYYWNKPGQ